MKLGDITIGGSWAARVFKVALVLVFIAGCWWGWRHYRGTQGTTDAQQIVQISLEQLQSIESGLQQIQAIPAQVRREVRQGVQAVVVRVGDYDSGARAAELERIIGIGRDIRSGRGDDNSE